MAEFSVVGGVYQERCAWPFWDQVYGSGGRAAAALSSLCSPTLHTYANHDANSLLEACGAQFGFRTVTAPVEALVAFDYSHPLAVPFIQPDRSAVKTHEALPVSGEVVLRFGMLEGSAVVEADTCVYDPQNQINPESFHANGSRAGRLAIVANRREVQQLTGAKDAVEGARTLLAGGADCVVVKAGVLGATVVDHDGGATSVSPYSTESVWPIGSGDVFAAGFAWWWSNGESPSEAARLASLGTAAYANSRALPLPGRAGLEQLGYPPAVPVASRVYLAGPFFDVGQRWVVDELRRALRSVGQTVFSPVHDVGSGAAADVAPRDLEAIRWSEVVFAVAAGMDPGTLFEIGYARAEGKLVYVLAQGTKPEDLKMIKGSGCRVFDDFTTAIYRSVWRT